MEKKKLPWMIWDDGAQYCTPFRLSLHLWLPLLSTLLFRFLILNVLEISSSLPTQAPVSKSTVLLSIDGCHMVMATNICIDRIV